MEQKNLLVTKASIITQELYKLTLDLPYKYQSSIGDQLRRSSLSISLNLVEGGARKSIKEKKQFLNITFGSLKESKYLLNFMSDLNLIPKDFYQVIMAHINELACIIYTLLYRK